MLHLACSWHEGFELLVECVVVSAGKVEFCNEVDIELLGDFLTRFITAPVQLPRWSISNQLTIASQGLNSCGMQVAADALAASIPFQR